MEVFQHQKVQVDSRTSKENCMNSLPFSLYMVFKRRQRKFKIWYKIISDAVNTYYCLVQSLLSLFSIQKYTEIKLCRLVILLYLLYGCEIWSFKLTEESRLKVFENRLLKKILGPKREEVMGLVMMA